jgi:hypothetical protein
MQFSVVDTTYSPKSLGPMLRARSEVEVTSFWVTVKVTAAGQGERAVTAVPLPGIGKLRDNFRAIAL